MVDDFEDFFKGKSRCSLKTLMKRKFRLHSLYASQNSLTLTESSVEFSDLHSIFRLRALRYRRDMFQDEWYVKSRDETNNTSSQSKERNKNMKWTYNVHKINFSTKLVDLNKICGKQCFNNNALGFCLATVSLINSQRDKIQKKTKWSYK